MLVMVAAVYPAEPPRGTARFAGVGAILSLLKGATYPTVMEIRPGSAAAADGRLATGDEIVAVAPDGNESSFIELKGLSLAEMVALMRGPEGTPVALKVRPRDRTIAGGGETVVALTRKMLNLPPPEPGTRISGAITDSDQPYHCAAFAGAQKGRWRVKARNSLGESEWSEYREFEFRQ